MIKLIGIILCLLALAVAVGCGKKNIVVLMPGPDGAVGRVEVTNPEGTQILTQARQATRVTGPKKSPLPPYSLPQKKIDRIFGRALAAQPEQPVTYILYFKSGSAELTEVSAELLPRIIETIKQRHSVDTSVVGHADTAGSEEYNYRLSHQRAEDVSRLLIKAGVDRDILEITSHGEKNQLVPTGDDTQEPRNRRVEVTVR